MRLPEPPRSGFNPPVGPCGPYFSLGSKPASEFWVPGGSKKSAEPGVVPERFRGLRLRRRTRSRVESTSVYGIVAFGTVMLGFLYLLFWRVLG